MSELTALLAGGVVAGALFDAYAYYRYKYSQRALEVAQGGSESESGSENASETDAAQKTLAQEIAEENEENASEGVGSAESAGRTGGRKSLAERLKEIDEAREQRKARNSGFEDGAVLFEPAHERKENGETEGARLERVGLREGDYAESEGVESGFADSIAALRASIADLNAVLKKRSWRDWRSRSGSAASLGDSSEGASFSGVDSSDSNDYSKGDYGFVSG